MVGQQGTLLSIKGTKRLWSSLILIKDPRLKNLLSQSLRSATGFVSWKSLEVNQLFHLLTTTRCFQRQMHHGEGAEPAVRRTYAARVTVSCPEKGDVAGNLVLLPQSFQELLEIGAKKYGFIPAKILSKDGAAIDDIQLIRDGDQLVLVSDDRNYGTD
ncbi:RAC-alpha serine/threonine-protein kinase [Salvia divinorum]|uniref:RAC-alpha serine/threonine-protein kinase n=1 Tax=Salvia divinorum TaxID=28513 RepID=A0ABD1I4G2_SALDI